MTVSTSTSATASCSHLLRVAQDGDDGVVGAGDDPMMRTAPLGVVSGPWWAS